MEKNNMILVVCGIVVVIAVIVITMFIPGKESKPFKENLLGIEYNIDGNEGEINYKSDKPVVAMNIENYGSIIIELYPDIAPNTVNNFISLVRSGFYDNNNFHRLSKGFVLQGGDPSGNGTGGPGYSIKGEFTNNGFVNSLKHTKGIVSMARASDPNSAGSQFFIMLGTAVSLDGDYAAFGKVVKGMDAIDAIEKNESVNGDSLVKNLVIKKALVNLNGYEAREVEKISE